jgi:magnesium-transporting ATPase (P-type)
MLQLIGIRNRPSDGYSRVDVAGVSMSDYAADFALLGTINIPQAKDENRRALDEIGGADGLIMKLGVNPDTGLTTAQVKTHLSVFGDNSMPSSPQTSYLTLLVEALSDTTLLILLAAAAVSFGTGYWEDPDIGWVEGAAIFIAVFLVSNISAMNDYSKEIQFRELEKSSAQDQQASVLRNGAIEQINPKDIVIGDILVLQAGDQIAADCVIVDSSEVCSNESALTGEPVDLTKRKDADCFLLSSCLITETKQDKCKAVVIGTGMSSQWGKIKAELVTETVNTPLQDKLQRMTELVSIPAPYMFMHPIAHIVTITDSFAVFVSFLRSVTSAWHSPPPPSPRWL